jgi:Ca2+-binding RTX toxin-like protein
MCIYVGSVVQNTDQNGNPTLDVVVDDTVNGTFDGFYGLGGNDDMTFIEGTIGLDTAPTTTTYMYGGEGNDKLTFSTGTSGTLSGDAGNDSISFNGSGIGTLFGGDGNDSITGGAQKDIIDAGRGEDVASGQAGNDVIEGRAGFDRLYGNQGQDTIDGGGSVDWITGGGAKDLLTGGAGKDVFFYFSPSDSGNTSTTRDVIADFNAGTATTAVDKINIGGIDAIQGGGHDLFTFVTGNFTAAGQVRVIQSGANALVQLNTVGTGGAEVVIQLNNVNAANMTAADFEFILI